MKKFIYLLSAAFFTLVSLWTGVYVIADEGGTTFALTAMILYLVGIGFFIAANEEFKEEVNDERLLRRQKRLPTKRDGGHRNRVQVGPKVGSKEPPS